MYMRGLTNMALDDSALKGSLASIVAITILNMHELAFSDFSNWCVSEQSVHHRYRKRLVFLKIVWRIILRGRGTIQNVAHGLPSFARRRHVARLPGYPGYVRCR